MHPGVFAAREPERTGDHRGRRWPGGDLRRAGGPLQPGGLAGQALRAAPGGRAGRHRGEPARAVRSAWGAQRSGLQFTAVNWHLTGEEAGYVVTDSRARMVVVSSTLASLAAQLGPVLAPGVRRLMIGGTIPGWDSFEDAVGALPTTPIPDECEGDVMLYSSGTTGRRRGSGGRSAGRPSVSIRTSPGTGCGSCSA